MRLEFGFVGRTIATAYVGLAVIAASPAAWSQDGIKRIKVPENTEIRGTLDLATASKPTGQADRTRMRKVEVLGDQTNPYATVAGRQMRDVASVNLFGQSPFRYLAVHLADFDSSTDPVPRFSNPLNPSIALQTVSLKTERVGTFTDAERKHRFVEWGLSEAGAPEDGEIVIVRADIPKTALPGWQLVEFDGANQVWPLLYAALAAEIQLARQVNQGNWEPSGFAHVGDRVRLQLRVSNDLPLDEIPLFIKLGASEFKPDSLPVDLKSGSPVLAVRVSGDAGLFATSPILIGDGNTVAGDHPDYQPGDIELKLPSVESPGDKARGLVLASIDPDFVGERFLMPVAPLRGSAAFPVLQASSSTIWLAALHTAGRCAGIDIETRTWDSLPAAKKGEISRVSVNSLGFYVKSFVAGDAGDVWQSQPVMPTTEVAVGHHAAMLLLRDELVALLRIYADRLDDASDDDDAARRMLRTTLDAGYFDLKKSAFQLTMLEGFDGKPVPFWHLRKSDAELKKAAGKAVDVNQWRLEQMQFAAGQLREFAFKAVKAMSAIDECDSRDLLRTVGAAHGPVSASLKPKLLKGFASLKGNRPQLHWKADVAARNWVDMVSDLAAQVRARDREADIDSIALKAQLAVATVGGLASSAAPGLAESVVSTADLAVTVPGMLKNAANYIGSDDELAIARGTSLLIGPAHYERLRKQTATTGEFYVTMALDLFGVAVSAKDAVRTVKQIWRSVYKATTPEMPNLLQILGENAPAGRPGAAADAGVPGSPPRPEVTLSPPRLPDPQPLPDLSNVPARLPDPAPLPDLTRLPVDAGSLPHGNLVQAAGPFTKPWMEALRPGALPQRVRRMPAGHFAFEAGPKDPLRLDPNVSKNYIYATRPDGTINYAPQAYNPDGTEILKHTMLTEAGYAGTSGELVFQNGKWTINQKSGRYGSYIRDMQSREIVSRPGESVDAAKKLMETYKVQNPSGESLELVPDYSIR